MLLRMLGYKESDIGPFWPADYIAQANALGLTQGVSIKRRQNTGHPCGRRDHAAQYARHLDALGRTGGLALISRVSSSTVENCILLRNQRNRQLACGR